MKVVISSFGSSGDFNPCLGLGRALRNKGVDVLFLSNPYYEKTITDAGLRFCPAGDYFDVFKEIADNPDYLHARRGPRAVWKMVLKTVPVMYRAMNELIIKESPDIVACHLLEYGGMIASVEQSIPYATISPTPMGWFSATQPAYMNFAELPAWVRRIQAHFSHSLMNIAIKYSLNSYCRKRRIPQLFENVDQVYSKASLNLGLWSKLLKDHSIDDPPDATICGFVQDEHIKDWPDVPTEIAKFFKGPKRPVVVGLGSTASLHGDTIYQRAVAACRSLDWPCLLVGKDLEKYADPQKAILTVDFAPYGWVFPRAGMVIHHGGLNTTAETLRAGVPGLVIPHGYDQFDNAIRIQKMRVAKRLKTSLVTSPIFLETIQAILGDTHMHDCAKALSIHLQGAPDGADTAAEQIIQALL